MRKLVFIILCLVPILAKSQDTKPTSNLIPLQTPNNAVFYYLTTDSTVWIYKGSYGWTKLEGASKKELIWNHKGISNTGWTVGKVLGFDSTGKLVPVNATIDVSGFVKYERWQQYIANDNDADFTCPFTLRADALVFYNGEKLNNIWWTGVGTSSLHLSFPTKKYDIINIQN